MTYWEPAIEAIKAGINNDKQRLTEIEEEKENIIADIAIKEQAINVLKTDTN